MNLDAGERFPPEVLRNGFERDAEALDVRREQDWLNRWPRRLLLEARHLA
jgi:hypothetical protein